MCSRYDIMDASLAVLVLEGGRRSGRKGERSRYELRVAPLCDPLCMHTLKLSFLKTMATNQSYKSVASSSHSYETSYRPHSFYSTRKQPCPIARTYHIVSSKETPNLNFWNTVSIKYLYISSIMRAMNRYRVFLNQFRSARSVCNMLWAETLVP